MNHLTKLIKNRIINSMNRENHSDFYAPHSLCFLFLCNLPIESPIKSKDLDLAAYSTKQLSPDYRIHWRILKDKNEIEIVAVVNGTSWVGLGWRPRKLNATCRNFPLIQKLSTSNQAVPLQLNAADKAKPTPEPESRV